MASFYYTVLVNWFWGFLIVYYMLPLLGSEYELLKKKYLQESSERRRLYNEVIELKGNIRVFCRCRPLSESETANGFASVVNFESSSENELQVVCSDSSKKQFKFDHVFRPGDNQGIIYFFWSAVNNLFIFFILEAD